MNAATVSTNFGTIISSNMTIFNASKCTAGQINFVSDYFSLDASSIISTDTGSSIFRDLTTYGNGPGFGRPCCDVSSGAGHGGMLFTGRLINTNIKL